VVAVSFNPSVHVDTSYQVIFPPSVQYVTQHAKREMATWPVADTTYNNFDYSGVNVSWWKNIGVPSSFFAWDPQEDYFGGYDHAKQAGTVWVGNHHTSPGMKFWAWGNNPAGDRFNSELTDEDGHYIELMAGAYTDNQPDYSWLQPYEGKSVKMIWFPIRDLGGLKYANRNGALNLEMTGNNIAKLRINSTSPHKQAKVVFKVKGDTMYHEMIDICPSSPFKVDIDLPTGVSEDDLSLALFSKEGEKLLYYKPAEHHPPDYPIPEALKPPAAPEKVKTNEELYLIGLRLNQFYNSSMDSYPYYEEALKRDPGDYRVNTQLGILYIKRKMWKEAEQKLRAAVERITSNYTRPKDGEGLYYLGIALKAQGKNNEAYDYFYRASWSVAWHTPAYYQLAEIDCQRNDFEKALVHLNRSICTNNNNLKALNLKAIVLRKLGETEQAKKQVKLVLDKDILNHQARNELFLLESKLDSQKKAAEIQRELTTIMRDEVQSYLELATDYGNCGFYEEAINVLTRLEKQGNSYPMLYYYLGYYWAQEGMFAKALDYYKIANQMPHAYCFPFRAESIEVLHHAMELNPTDARAPYYLGNLLYELQPENAIIEWEKSRALNDSFYIVHRNLAIAYEEVHHDISKSMLSLEKAVTCYSEDPRLLFEMDVLYEKNKALPQKKYELLKNNSETVKRRSETLLRLATRSVEAGKYNEALEILLNNNFVQFEGGREMQDTYLNVYVLRGKKFFNEGQYDKALNDFETGLAYPIGRFGRSRRAQLNYLVGSVYETLGESSKAKTYYQNTLDIDIPTRGRDREFLFYQGLALNKIGKSKESKKTFQKILDIARQENESAFFRQFEGGQSRDMQVASDHYLAGLAYKGLGKNKKAKTEFNKALSFNPGHIWANFHLESLSE